MVTARKDQPAALKRRIAVLEAALEAERKQHDRMLAAWRDAVIESAELGERLKSALAALRGEA